MNEKTIKAQVISSDAGESFWVLGDHYRFKTTAQESDGTLAVVEVTAFPQNGPPAHIHLREDESFYVLSGRVTVLLEDKTVDIGAGSFVRIPRGTLHTYSNSGNALARVLVTLTPAGFENFWREIGEPAHQSSEPVAPPSDIISKITALAPKYGLKIPSLQSPA